MMTAARNLPGVGLLIRRWRTESKPMPLTVGIKRENGTAILHLQDRLTFEHMGVLTAALEEARQNGVARILVNLTGCPFTDSAGVAALVTAAQQAKRTGRGFLLTGVRDQVRNVLRMSRLEGLFPICDTLNEALNEQGDDEVRHS